MKRLLLLAAVVGSCGSLAGPATAASTTRWVNGTGVVGANTSCADPGYTLIKDAVDAASPGDTIHICAGTYAENVEVGKPLSIVGAGSGATKIQPGSGSYGLDLHAPVDLSDLRVTVHSGDGIRVEPEPNSGRLAFAGVTWDNIVSSENKRGVEIAGQTDISDMSIQSSDFSSNGDNEGLNTESDTTIDGLRITNSTFTLNHFSGLFLRGTINNLVVSHSSITNNHNYGLHATGPITNVAIDHTTITANFTAISLSTASTIDGVSITRSALYDYASSGQTHDGLSVSAPFTNVTATCNWWGDSTGPSGAGAGSGSTVTAGVGFTPWLTTSTLDGACDGGAPYGTKQSLKGTLVGVAASPGTSKKDAKKLTEAAAKLGESLDGSLWVDDSHLQAKHGNKVFDKEKEAAKKLEELQKDKKSGLDDSLLQSWIDELVGADQALAQTAIDDAHVAMSAHSAGSQKELDHAQKELDKTNDEMGKAQKELDKGHYDKAIDHYKKAWQHAQKAIQHSNKA